MSHCRRIRLYLTGKRLWRQFFNRKGIFIGYFSQFVRAGGQIGIIVPGLQREFDAGIPPHLASNWEWDFCSFHSPEWWKNHWQKAGKVEVVLADWVSDGWKQWLLWEQVCREAGYPYGENDMALLEADSGQYLGFTRVVARKKM